MKRFLTFVVAVVMVFGVIGFSGCASKTVDDGAGVTIATEVNVAPSYSLSTSDFSGKSLKVGAILVGDETEGYTKAHMDGIEKAVANLKAVGATVNVQYKKKIGEDATCTTAISQLISGDCTAIFSNSYGHQTFMATEAVKTENKNITFVAMTGDFASISGISNLKNAFTDVYESRYVSGVVAGLKLKQLVADNKLISKNYDGDNIKIGYVGAYNYAEVVSGYTAFYLGIKSVVSNITMEVNLTNSWFNFDAEYQNAKALISDGCIIIGQHADSEGAPTACEEEYKKGTRVYSVGYNVDMLNAAPHAALTSATNVWEVYYTEAFAALLKGEAVPTDWAKGYDDGAVAITPINGKVFTSDPSAQIKAVVDQIKAKTLKVFDTSKFTVKGNKITTNMVDPSHWDYSKEPAVKDYSGDSFESIKTESNISYFDESSYRSAPYFALAIDGIKQI